MTTIEDATKEDDQFWIDIANSLTEFHGMGAKGEPNQMYGKQHSEEWRRTVSEALTGPKNPMFGSHGGNYGRKYTEETRKR